MFVCVYMMDYGVMNWLIVMFTLDGWMDEWKALALA